MISPQSKWLLNSGYWDIPLHLLYTETNMTFTRGFHIELVYTSQCECVTHWALLKVPLKFPLTVRLKHCHEETNVQYIKKHVKKLQNKRLKGRQVHVNGCVVCCDYCDTRTLTHLSWQRKNTEGHIQRLFSWPILVFLTVHWSRATNCNTISLKVPPWRRFVFKSPLRGYTISIW